MLGTVSIELLIHLSQFNFKPFTCTIVASSHAGDIRKTTLVEAAHRLGLVPNDATTTNNQQEDQVEQQVGEMEMAAPPLDTTPGY